MVRIDDPVVTAQLLVSRLGDGDKQVEICPRSKITPSAHDLLRARGVEVVADRGYFSSLEILACDEAGITVTLPKPMTSGIQAKGRFGKQDFVYLAADDVYRCPAGAHLAYHFTNVEKGLPLHRYWTTACRTCAIKDQCTTGKERRINPTHYAASSCCSVSSILR